MIASRVWRSASVWLVYVLGFIPAAWYFYLGATGQIPGNAIKVFEHLLGVWALRFLLVTLAVTPIRDLLGVNLIRYRRALGLLAFWYVVMHFSTYMILDQALNFQVIVNDIAKRPFITIGMGAFALLVPLAITSNSWSIRKLGSRWNSLHKLSYVIILGGALHYLMAVRVITPEPAIYMALAAILVGYRLLFRPRVLAWRKQRNALAMAR